MGLSGATHRCKCGLDKLFWHFPVPKIIHTCPKIVSLELDRQQNVCKSYNKALLRVFGHTWNLKRLLIEKFRAFPKIFPTRLEDFFYYWNIVFSWGSRCSYLLIRITCSNKAKATSYSILMQKVLHNATKLWPLFGQPPIFLIQFLFAENVQPLHDFWRCCLSIKTQIFPRYVNSFSKHVKNQPQELLTRLNNCHPNIKFEINSRKFLLTELSLVKDMIHTSVVRK